MNTIYLLFITIFCCGLHAIRQYFQVHCLQQTSKGLIEQLAPASDSGHFAHMLLDWLAWQANSPSSMVSCQGHLQWGGVILKKKCCFLTYCKAFKIFDYYPKISTQNVLCSDFFKAKNEKKLSINCSYCLHQPFSPILGK